MPSSLSTTWCSRVTELTYDGSWADSPTLSQHHTSPDHQPFNALLIAQGDFGHQGKIPQMCEYSLAWSWLTALPSFGHVLREQESGSTPRAEFHHLPGTTSLQNQAQQTYALSGRFHACDAVQWQAEGRAGRLPAVVNSWASS